MQSETLETLIDDRHKLRVRIVRAVCGALDLGTLPELREELADLERRIAGMWERDFAESLKAMHVGPEGQSAVDMAVSAKIVGLIWQAR